MMLRRFFGIVPKPVKRWALVLMGCALLVGLVVGSKAADQGAVFWTMSAYGAAGFMLGTMLAVWLMCLGFVFADARRRAMRAVLWVLVAALFPHLLGFLLYFVLRQPIALICMHCGKTGPLQQRFCSWCGASLVQNSTDGPLAASSLQGASQ